jgi:hypothetical protein
MSAESPLDKVLRFSQGQSTASSAGPGDELRELVRAVHLVLTEVCQDPDPSHAATLVYAAAAMADDLDSLLYGDGLEDWVEATSAPADSTQVLLAGAATKPYGDVPYADPGYIGGRKRYPIDEKHVKAAWSYINQAKNGARYTASQLASIKSKIKGALKRAGHGSNLEAAMSGGGDRPVLAQLVEGEAWVMLAKAPDDKGIPMHHAPHHGTHSHAHSVTMTHDHEHSHAGDGEHAGPAHGNNFGQKAWAAKGEAGWAAHEHAKYTALAVAATPQKPTPPAPGSSGATSNQSASSGQAAAGGLNEAAATSGSGLDSAAKGSAGSSPATYTGPAIGNGAGHIHAHGSTGSRSK